MLPPRSPSWLGFVAASTVVMMMMPARCSGGSKPDGLSEVRPMKSWRTVAEAKLENRPVVKLE